jgi:hypothetical protein
VRAEELRAAFPSYGPDWEKAIDYGIDVSLLLENLELTPTERLQQLEKLNELYDEVRSARGLDAEER